MLGTTSTLKQRETTIVVAELFWACKEQPPCLDRIRSIVEEYPAAASAKRWRNYYPVTAACGTAGASLEVIQYLVKQYPQALYVEPQDTSTTSTSTSSRDNHHERRGSGGGGMKQNRNLLLHHALWSNKGVVALDVLEYLLQLEPRLASVPDYTGWLPLHAVCRMICTDASKTNIVDNDKNNKERLKVIQALVRAFPDSVMARTNDGRLPLDVLLHEAIRESNNTNNSAAAAAAANSSSMQQQPSPPQAVLDAVTVVATGYPPLHFACRYNTPMKTIQYLLQRYPDAVSTPTAAGIMVLDNDSGMLPLHCACLGICSSSRHKQKVTTTATTPPLDVLQLLLRHNEHAISAKTSTNGQLPLHCACRAASGDGDLPLDILEYLVQQNPASVAALDNEGHLAGQLLCLNSTTSEQHHCPRCDSLYFLLRRNPQAILAMTHRM